ncbi:MAG: hypothetical protein RBQ97_04160 [Acholeplasma sp.]|nr:hypothetical protein [Acholeplasma sp.]
MSIKTFNNLIGIKASNSDIAMIRRKLAYLVDERLGMLVDKNHQHQGEISFNQKVRSYQNVILQWGKGLFENTDVEVIKFIASFKNNVIVSKPLTYQIDKIIAKDKKCTSSEVWESFKNLINASIQMDQIDYLNKPYLSLKRVIIVGESKHLGRSYDLDYYNNVGRVWNSHNKNVFDEVFPKSKTVYGMGIDRDVVGNTLYFIGHEVKEKDFLGITDEYSKVFMKNKEPFAVFTQTNVNRKEIGLVLSTIHKQVVEWFAYSTVKKKFEGNTIDEYDENNKIFKVYIPIMYKV